MFLKMILLMKMFSCAQQKHAIASQKLSNKKNYANSDCIKLDIIREDPINEELSLFIDEELEWHEDVDQDIDWFHGLLNSIPSNLDERKPLFDDLSCTDYTKLNDGSLIVLKETLTKLKNKLSGLRLAMASKSIEFQYQEDAQFISTEKKISDLINFVNSQLDRLKTIKSEKEQNGRVPEEPLASYGKIIYFLFAMVPLSLFSCILMIYFSEKNKYK